MPQAHVQFGMAVQEQDLPNPLEARLALGYLRLAGMSSIGQR